MKRLLLTLFAFAALVAGCGGQTISNGENQAVLDRINSEKSCAALQGEFKRADKFGHLDYMKAADARMRKLGCYQ